MHFDILFLINRYLAETSTGVYLDCYNIEPHGDNENKRGTTKPYLRTIY